MFCKNCGAQLPDNALICQNCGTQTGASAPPPPVYCRNCGAQNHPASGACVNCGAPLGGYNNGGYNNACNPNAKSRMAAGLLAFLLGRFGVHNFYLGYNNKGLAQLLISVLTVGIFSWISYIWAIVEGVQIFTGTISTDANGVPFKD